MNRKNHIRAIHLVTVALISTSCLGQQAQEEARGFSPASIGAIAASANTVSATAAPLSVSPAAKKAPSEPVVNPDAPPASDLRPALRQELAPARRTRGGPILLRSIFGQRGDVGIFAVGNFNPTYYVGLDYGRYQVSGSNKSSLGGGTEYRRYWNRNNALGLLYVQNPSDGNLWVPSGNGAGRYYIWPQMRYEASVLATQRLPIGKLTPFVSEGPGAVVTNGYGNCGWSGGFAFVVGLGTEYEFSPRLSARAGVTFLDTKSGCYDDPTCRQTWGVVEDLRIGFAYKWGGQNGRYLAR
jgi:hypothetical protein